MIAARNFRIGIGVVRSFVCIGPNLILQANEFERKSGIEPKLTRLAGYFSTLFTGQPGVHTGQNRYKTVCENYSTK